MTNKCDNCLYTHTCWARIGLEELIQGFKLLAMTPQERDNCGVTNTIADITAALGGACTARKEETK